MGILRERTIRYPLQFVGEVRAWPGSGTRLMMCWNIFADSTGALVNSQWVSEEMWNPWQKGRTDG